jgi:hypothetical protein
MIALNSRFIPKKNCIESVRNAALNNIDSWGLQLGTYASHERFNDQTLFLHPKEIRPLFELRGCGHLGKNSIE